MTAQEEPVATSDAPKVGSLNIAITSFSINTSSIDNDANISLPLWGRVVTKASDDVWVQSSNFAKSVGWAVPEGEADGDEAAAVEKFTFGHQKSPSLVLPRKKQRREKQITNLGRGRTSQTSCQTL